ncbi:hypothetical protein [Fibrobacter sp.]|uniref:hypothetical protein n=1 Tax=Fibrobacter sp. TaxID=35828 RepID=UPI00388F68BC
MENNVETKKVVNKKKVGIGAALAGLLIGGATYLLCKNKKGSAAETEDFDSDTPIDEIPGEGEAD